MINKTPPTSSLSDHVTAIGHAHRGAGTCRPPFCFGAKREVGRFGRENFGEVLGFFGIFSPENVRGGHGELVGSFRGGV